MKKILLSTAVLLLSLLAHSQEANDFGKYAEVSLISRLDLNPSLSAGEIGFDHGNSSIYTLFEGAASEHFSWTLVNHWLHAGGEYAWPYTSLGYSNTTNWLELCVATFSYGNWSLNLGKDIISTGGFEYEEWDWDTHLPLASSLWNYLAAYQWGGKLTYSFLGGNSISAQMTTSPYGERPFSSNLWNYSFQFRGEAFGWFTNICSVSFLQYAANAYDTLVAVGHNFELSESHQIGFDIFKFHGGDPVVNLGCGDNFILRYKFLPSDNLNLTINGRAEHFHDKTWQWNAGAALEYYPIKDSEDLRLHAVLAYQSLIDTAIFSVGIRYNLVFNLF